MFRMSRLLICVLILLLAVSAVAAQDSIAPGDVVEGEAEDEIVTYAIDLEAGQSVALSLESDFFARLDVLDANETAIATSEDIGFSDNYLVATAEETGTHTIVIGSLFGEPSGMYTLSVIGVELTPLVVDETNVIAADGEPAYFASFEAAAGDVVNVYANSLAEEDTRMRLKSTSGVPIADDDDSGFGSNPYIRRIVLPEDGTYVVYLEGFAGSPITADVELTVEQTEVLLLTEEPTEVALGEAAGIEVEFLTLDATAGTTYRLIIEAESVDADVRMAVSLGDFVTNTLSASTFSRTTMDFVVTEAVMARVEMSSFIGGTFMVSAEVME